VLPPAPPQVNHSVPNIMLITYYIVVRLLHADALQSERKSGCVPYLHHCDKRLKHFCSYLNDEDLLLCIIKLMIIPLFFLPKQSSTSPRVILLFSSDLLLYFIPGLDAFVHCRQSFRKPKYRWRTGQPALSQSFKPPQKPPRPSVHLNLGGVQYLPCPLAAKPLRFVLHSQELTSLKTKRRQSPTEIQ